MVVSGYDHGYDLRVYGLTFFMADDKTYRIDGIVICDIKKK